MFCVAKLEKLWFAMWSKLALFVTLCMCCMFIIAVLVAMVTNNFVEHINSLAPGRSECNSKTVIFNLVLLIDIFRSFHDNAVWWMPQDLTDDKSTLVQVMFWCRQATSHYLSQCWLSSLSLYGVARPQWVKIFNLIFNLFYGKTSFSVIHHPNFQSYLIAYLIGQVTLVTVTGTTNLVPCIWIKSLQLI